MTQPFGLVFTCLPEGRSKPLLVQLFADNREITDEDLSVFGRILKLFTVGNREEAHVISNELRKELL